MTHIVYLRSVKKYIYNKIVEIINYSLKSNTPISFIKLHNGNFIETIT